MGIRVEVIEDFDFDNYFDAEFIEKEVSQRRKLFEHFKGETLKRHHQYLMRYGITPDEGRRFLIRKEIERMRYYYTLTIKERLLDTLRFWLKSQIQERLEESYDKGLDFADVYVAGIRMLEHHKTEEAILYINNKQATLSSFPIDFSDLRWHDIQIYKEDGSRCLWAKRHFLLKE